MSSVFSKDSPTPPWVLSHVIAVGFDHNEVIAQWKNRKGQSPAVSSFSEEEAKEAEVLKRVFSPDRVEALKRISSSPINIGSIQNPSSSFFRRSVSAPTTYEKQMAQRVNSAIPFEFFPVVNEEANSSTYPFNDQIPFENANLNVNQDNLAKSVGFLPIDEQTELSSLEAQVTSEQLNEEETMISQQILRRLQELKNASNFDKANGFIKVFDEVHSKAIFPILKRGVDRNPSIIAEIEKTFGKLAAKHTEEYYKDIWEYSMSATLLENVLDVAEELDIDNKEFLSSLEKDQKNSVVEILKELDFHKEQISELSYRMDCFANRYKEKFFSIGLDMPVCKKNQS